MQSRTGRSQQGYQGQSRWYSEFLAQVQSKPRVWEGVLHAQKSLPTDVSKSIEAMFSSAGRKKGRRKGFLDSPTTSVRKASNCNLLEKLN